MRDDCNPTSTPPDPPPAERDPMDAGEGDGPSFDVMPRVVYLPREGKVLDFWGLMLLDTGILLRMCRHSGPHTALYVCAAGARLAAVHHA